MPTKFEYAEDSYEPNDTQNGQRHGLVGAFILRTDRRSWQIQRVLLLGHHGGQRDKVRNDGDDIDKVHDVPEEVQLVGTGQEAHGQLEREPDDADGLYEEERVRDVRHLVLLYLGTVRRRIEHLWYRQCQVFIRES